MAARRARGASLVVAVSFVRAAVLTPFDTTTSGLASMARMPLAIGASTTVAATIAAKPASPVLPARLFDVEGCSDCRRVRETITYLDLALTIVPCVPGSRGAALKGVDPAGGTPPLLEDGGQVIVGADAVIEHLFRLYAPTSELPPPAEPELQSRASSLLAATLRRGRGVALSPRALPGVSPELSLFSYEGNRAPAQPRPMCSSPRTRETVRLRAPVRPQDARPVGTSGRWRRRSARSVIDAHLPSHHHRRHLSAT